MYIEHVFVLFMLSLSVQCVDYGIPRGVSPNAAAFFDPSKDFTCFDGLIQIPFKQVNDDYCDCHDGTDEPGTSACANGWFHCINAGYMELQIPASRVNDGVCDCCDGSDEWLTNHCFNSCSALNEAARAHAEARAKLMSEGNDLRQQLIYLAKQIRLEKEERLKKLEEEKVEAEKVKAAAETQKNQAEEAENAALQIYRDAEEQARQEKLQREREESAREAHDVFVNLDSNQNGLLDAGEIKVKQIFDRNKDGQVSDDEMTWYLDLKTNEVTEAMFHESIWPNIKAFYMMERGLFTPPALLNEDEERPHEDVLPEEHHEQEEVGEGADSQHDGVGEKEEEESHHEEEEEEEEEVEEPTTGEGEVNPQEEPPAEPVYDPRTQQLIEEAKEARSQFESSEQALQNIQRELDQIREKLEMDYGPEDEYAPLDGQCFSYTDREYTYKLCPFGQVTQAPKSGGSETRLGSWGGWLSEEGGPAMMYDKGQACWNGPQRSTKVYIECGSENAVTNVIEPNKCEYQMQFITPAACKIHDPDKHSDTHDEL